MQTERGMQKVRAGCIGGAEVRAWLAVFAEVSTFTHCTGSNDGGITNSDGWPSSHEVALVELLPQQRICSELLIKTELWKAPPRSHGPRPPCHGVSYSALLV